MPDTSGSPASREAPEEPLVLRDVTFARGDRTILDRVSLSVAPGEIVALIGPSGAGKTTIFRLALGFLRPDAGEIWISGREISKLSERELVPVRANVGILFQDAALFTSMSVAENVGFGLAESGIPEADLTGRVHQALARVGLEGFEERMPDELSGGQAQRVAVARAIITAPRVMLFDEPTQGLDPQRALDVVDQIARLADSGVASLAVTHQLEYARIYADRVALLEDARIRYDGSIEGLRAFNDDFVKSFFDVLGGKKSRALLH